MRAHPLLLLMFVLAAAWLSTGGATADTIWDAANRGDIAAVRRYLSADPQLINFIGPDSNTPLHAAAWNGHADVVALLIDAGADVNRHRNYDGWTPLFCAAERGHVDCAQLLIDAGADVRARANDNNTAMHWAAARNFNEIIKLLIEHGADLNARQNSGWTPLHSAASSNAAAAIQTLLQSGADMQIRNNSGDAPIHTAARYGYPYQVGEFVDNGQDIDTRNADGDIPLDIAVRNGKTDVAKFLIGLGADLQARDKAGHTPLEIAQQAGKQDIMEVIQQYQNALAERAARDAARKASGITIRGGHLNWAEPYVLTKLVYSNDFTSGKVGSEWSTLPLPGAQQGPLRISITPIGSRHFLGEFGSQAARLAFSNLPAHQEISVDFDLFIIRSWDGNNLLAGPDTWYLRVVDGPTLLYTTFGNTWSTLTKNTKFQSYPGEYAGDHYGLQYGAVETNTLGYTFPVDGHPVVVDSVYKLSYTFPHSGAALLLDFAATGLEPLDNESWGITNVQVSVAEPAPVLPRHVTAVPPTRVHSTARPVQRPVTRRIVVRSSRTVKTKHSAKTASAKRPHAPARQRLHTLEKPPAP